MTSRALAAGLLLILLVASSGARSASEQRNPLAASNLAVSDLAGIDAYIETARAEFENIGVAVAVVQGDAVIYARGFGVREYGRPAGIDADTLFQVGSTTKAMTAAALGLLVEEGKIRWDDPVTTYLPEFQLEDPWLTRRLTIRDTVAHRSGIAETAYFVYAVMDADAAIDQLRYIAPQDRFRDSFNYSNLMYGVAGKIVATASGMSWGQFVERRLLQPLNMRRSGTSAYQFWDAAFVAPTYRGSAAAAHWSAAAAHDRNVAMPHVRDDQGVVRTLAWQSYDNAAAAGTVVSSAADMAKWLIANLNEGRFGDRQVLRRDTVRELHATQNIHAGQLQFPFVDSTEGYAMGWLKARYHSQVYLAHGGGIMGFPAYVALMPERRIGVVILSNSPKAEGDSYAFHKAIALRAFDQLLKAPPRNWSEEFLLRTQNARAEARREEEKLQHSRLRDAPPSLPLEQYVGEYEDLLLHSGRVRVRLDGGQLTLSFSGEGAFSGTLQHWHRDVFRLRPKTPLGWQGFPSFILDESGAVVAMSAFGTTLRRVAVERK